MATEVGSSVGAMVSAKRLEGTLAAPSVRRPVPNHLTDTKIYSKVCKNGLLQTNPPVVHFAGYRVGQTHQQTLRVVNISSDNQQMHIVQPSTSFFSIKYTKQRSLVPGLSLSITVQFHPTQWQYYYDCIRIHCKGDENLLVPIHAYPVMNVSKFPKNVKFPATPLGQHRSKTLSLECDVPVDFEFQLSFLQHHPAFSVSPMRGIVPANGKVDIEVTFAPTEFNTAIMKLQLEVSQFNSCPVVCTFTGGSTPGLAVDEVKQRSSEAKLLARTISKVHHVPLPRGRRGRKDGDGEGEGRKERRTTHSVVTLPGKVEEDIERNGILFPANMDNPHAVSKILTQQPGRVKMTKTTSQMVATGVGARQVKEKAFLQEVRRVAAEERANQLRWVTNLGCLAMTSEEKQTVVQEREKADVAYQRHCHVPVPEEEYTRSTTECMYRRTRRRAGEYVSHSPSFDLYSNDVWARRHLAHWRFVQAARKIVVRLRCQQRLERLKRLKRGVQEGKSIAQSLEDMVDKSTPVLDVVSELPKSADHILPFGFPRVREEEGGGLVAGCGVVDDKLKQTVVCVKKELPYMDLRVPQQYKLLGYSPVPVPVRGSYVPPDVPRPYRTGALEELENLAPIPGVDPAFLEPSGLFGGQYERWESRGKGEGGEEDGVTVEDMDGEEKCLPLVPPPGIFKPPRRHPLHIFNPSPGTISYVPMLPHSEITLEHSLLPLPPYPSAGNVQVRLDPQDVIPGVMRWKQFPSHCLMALEEEKKLSQFWKPSWSDRFSEELLPHDSEPQLLSGPQSDDLFDENSTEILVVPTPEMVRAKFYMPSQEEQDPRLEAQAKLELERGEHFDEFGCRVATKLETMMSARKLQDVVESIAAPRVKGVVEGMLKPTSKTVSRILRKLQSPEPFNDNDM